MRFGHMPLNTMNNKLKVLFAAVVVLAFGCNHNNNQQTNLSISPEAGSTYKAGSEVKVSVGLADIKPDSVVYLIDSVKLISKKDTTGITLKTDTMRLGIKLITAKVYQGGKSQDVSTNIVLLAAKAPENYTYKLIKVYPHDTTCYTEGLLYQDGYLYEGGGGQSKIPAGKSAGQVDTTTGQSSVRKVDLQTGKAVQKTMVDPTIFGEGISIVGDKLIELTWTEKIGYIYDKNTFKRLSTFANNIGVQGWGMTFDGNKLYMDDSTNRIWFIDKNAWRPIGYIDVYDDKGPIDSLNELEYIEGKIYANVYTKDYIMVIDPKTGAVLQKIDMSSLYPESSRIPPAEVMNGIAYDAKGKRIFVTGKKWQHLYQVEFVKK
jgi:glutamine cyclotransferase